MTDQTPEDATPSDATVEAAESGAVAEEVETAGLADAGATATDLSPKTEGESGAILPDAREPSDRENGVVAGWIYLAVWFAIFLAIALFAFSRTDDAEQSVVLTDQTTTTVAVVVPTTPADLLATVQGGQVTLTGAVPDEGARAQLVRLAEDLYGRGNVTDELTVDSDVSLTDGSLRVTGTAAEGDENPGLLQADAMSQLGLGAGAIDVDFALRAVDPVDVSLDVSAVPVVLTGIVPDELTIDRLTLAAEETYGQGNVDNTGLVVGSSTLDEGTIRVVGTVPPGDEQPAAVAMVLETDFATSSVELETEVDVSTSALDQVERDLRTALEAEPILFRSGSSQIDSASDEILVRVATVINAVPDIPVEIVGHTDSAGRAATNQRLSEDRAKAVLDRLVELDVEPERLSSRGEGSSNPVDDNTTPEGRAANRRIQFIFERQ